MLLDGGTCECVDQKEYFKFLLIQAFTWGVVIGVICALALEVAIFPYVPAFIALIVVAPIIEELLKSSVVFGERTRERIFFVVMVASLGFGLGEWAFHGILKGYFILSPTIGLHVLFTLPVAIMVGNRGPTWKNYIIGLLIAIVFHAVWNWGVTI